MSKSFDKNIKESLRKFSANLRGTKIFRKILNELYAKFGKMLKSVRNFFKISRKFQTDSVYCFLRYEETLVKFLIKSFCKKFEKILK